MTFIQRFVKSEPSRQSKEDQMTFMIKKDLQNRHVYISKGGYFMSLLDGTIKTLSSRRFLEIKSLRV